MAIQNINDLYGRLSEEESFPLLGYKSPEDLQNSLSSMSDEEKNDFFSGIVSPLGVSETDFQGMLKKKETGRTSILSSALGSIDLGSPSVSKTTEPQAIAPEVQAPEATAIEDVTAPLEPLGYGKSLGGVPTGPKPGPSFDWKNYLSEFQKKYPSELKPQDYAEGTFYDKIYKKEGERLRTEFNIQSAKQLEQFAKGEPITAPKFIKTKEEIEAEKAPKIKIQKQKDYQDIIGGVAEKEIEKAVKPIPTKLDVEEQRVFTDNPIVQYNIDPVAIAEGKEFVDRRKAKALEDYNREVAELKTKPTSLYTRLDLYDFIDEDGNKNPLNEIAIASSLFNNKQIKIVTKEGQEIDLRDINKLPGVSSSRGNLNELSFKNHLLSLGFTDETADEEIGRLKKMYIESVAKRNMNQRKNDFFEISGNNEAIANKRYLDYYNDKAIDLLTEDEKEGYNLAKHIDALHNTLDKETLRPGSLSANSDKIKSIQRNIKMLQDQLNVIRDNPNNLYDWRTGEFVNKSIKATPRFAQIQQENKQFQIKYGKEPKAELVKKRDELIQQREEVLNLMKRDGLEIPEKGTFAAAVKAMQISAARTAGTNEIRLPDGSYTNAAVYKKKMDDYNKQLFNIERELYGINRAVMLNEDVALRNKVERGYIETAAKGIGSFVGGALENIGRTITPGATTDDAKADWELRNSLFPTLEQSGFKIDPELKSAARKDVSESISDSAGTLLEAMVGIAAGNAFLPAIKSLKWAGKFKDILKTKYGKIGESLFDTSADMIRSGAVYSIAGQGAATGVGEQAGQAAFDFLNLDKYFGKKGRFLEYLARVIAGASAETLQEYAGQYLQTLTDQGVDINKNFKTAFGRDSETALDQFLQIAITSALFSGVSNGKILLASRTRLNEILTNPGVASQYGVVLDEDSKKEIEEVLRVVDDKLNDKTTMRTSEAKTKEISDEYVPASTATVEPGTEMETFEGAAPQAAAPVVPGEEGVGPVVTEAPSPLKISTATGQNENAVVAGEELGSETNTTFLSSVKNERGRRRAAELLSSAKDAVQTLKSVLPNAKIVFHSTESFNKKIDEIGGEKGGKANFSIIQNPDGTTDIEIQIDAEGADFIDLAHEITHGVLFAKMFNQEAKTAEIDQVKAQNLSPEQTTAKIEEINNKYKTKFSEDLAGFKKDLETIVDETTNKRLSDFIKKYKDSEQAEEYLVELAAIMSQEGTQLEQKDPGFITKLLAAINKYVGFIGEKANLKLQKFENAKDVVNFFNGISKAIRKGETLEGVELKPKPTAEAVGAQPVNAQELNKELAKDGITDVSLQKVEDYGKEIESGNADFERFSPSEQRGLIEGGPVHVAATVITGKSDRGTDTQDDSNDRQEEVVKEYAQKKGVWIENAPARLTEKYGKPFQSGKESLVWLDKERGVVVKSSVTNQYPTLREALDGITLSNAYFPAAKITVVGFGTNKDGDFEIITEQPYIQGVDATEQEIKEHFNKLGFTENEGLYQGKDAFGNEEVIFKDAAPKNVIKTPDGNIVPIDLIAKINKPELNANGTRTVPSTVAEEVTEAVPEAGQIISKARIADALEKSNETETNKLKSNFIIKKAEDISKKSEYLNCEAFCVRLFNNKSFKEVFDKITPNIRFGGKTETVLPKLQDILKVGDIISFGEKNNPRHYAVYLGGDSVYEVEQWGTEPRIYTVSENLDIYEGVNAIYRDENLNGEIAEAYVKAKADGSNPELVKAVEDLIGAQPVVTEQAPETGFQEPLAFMEDSDPAKQEQVNEIATQIVNKARATQDIKQDYDELSKKNYTLTRIGAELQKKGYTLGQIKKNIPDMADYWEKAAITDFVNDRKRFGARIRERQVAIAKAMEANPGGTYEQYYNSLKDKFGDSEIYTAFYYDGASDVQLEELFGSNYRQTIQKAIDSNGMNPDILRTLRDDARIRKINDRLDEKNEIFSELQDFVNAEEALAYMAQGMFESGAMVAMQTVTDQLRAFNEERAAATADMETEAIAPGSITKEMIAQKAALDEKIGLMEKIAKGEVAADTLISVSEMLSFSGRMLRMGRSLFKTPDGLADLIIKSLENVTVTMELGGVVKKKKVYNLTEKQKGKIKVLAKAYLDLQKRYKDSVKEMEDSSIAYTETAFAKHDQAKAEFEKAAKYMREYVGALRTQRKAGKFGDWFVATTALGLLSFRTIVVGIYGNLENKIAMAGIGIGKYRIFNWTRRAADYLVAKTVSSKTSQFANQATQRGVGSTVDARTYRKLAMNQGKQQILEILKNGTFDTSTSQNDFLLGFAPQDSIKQLGMGINMAAKLVRNYFTKAEDKMTDEDWAEAFDKMLIDMNRVDANGKPVYALQNNKELQTVSTLLRGIFGSVPAGTGRLIALSGDRAFFKLGYYEFLATYANSMGITDPIEVQRFIRLHSTPGSETDLAARRAGDRRIFAADNYVTQGLSGLRRLITSAEENLFAKRIIAQQKGQTKLQIAQRTGLFVGKSLLTVFSPFIRIPSNVINVALKKAVFPYSAINYALMNYMLQKKVNEYTKEYDPQLNPNMSPAKLKRMEKARLELFEQQKKTVDALTDVSQAIQVALVAGALVASGAVSPPYGEDDEERNKAIASGKAKIAPGQINWTHFYLWITGHDVRARTVQKGDVLMSYQNAGIIGLATAWASIIGSKATSIMSENKQMAGAGSDAVNAVSFGMVTESLTNGITGLSFIQTLGNAANAFKSDQAAETFFINLTKTALTVPTMSYGAFGFVERARGMNLDPLRGYEGEFEGGNKGLVNSMLNSRYAVRVWQNITGKSPLTWFGNTVKINGKEVPVSSLASDYYHPQKGPFGEDLYKKATFWDTKSESPLDIFMARFQAAVDPFSFNTYEGFVSKVRDYSKDAEYDRGDFVTYNNLVYIAKDNVKGSNPYEDSKNWEFVDSKKDFIDRKQFMINKKGTERTKQMVDLASMYEWATGEKKQFSVLNKIIDNTISITDNEGELKIYVPAEQMRKLQGMLGEAALKSFDENEIPNLIERIKRVKEEVQDPDKAREQIKNIVQDKFDGFIGVNSKRTDGIKDKITKAQSKIEETSEYKNLQRKALANSIEKGLLSEEEYLRLVRSKEFGAFVSRYKKEDVKFRK